MAIRARDASAATSGSGAPGILVIACQTSRSTPCSSASEAEIVDGPLGKLRRRHVAAENACEQPRRGRRLSSHRISEISSSDERDAGTTGLTAVAESWPCDGRWSAIAATTTKATALPGI